MLLTYTITIQLIFITAIHIIEFPAIGYEGRRQIPEMENSEIY
jgi:hypothetical protein